MEPFLSALNHWWMHCRLKLFFNQAAKRHATSLIGDYFGLLLCPHDLSHIASHFLVSFLFLNIVFSVENRGRDCSVGIPTRYGLDGPGIEYRWGRVFRTCPDQPWGPPSLLYNGYRAFPGGKAVWELRLPPTTILRRGSRKRRAIHLLPLWDLVACYRVKFTLLYFTSLCWQHKYQSDTKCNTLFLNDIHLG